MDFFENFIESDAFFPVLIGLLLLLILIFLGVLLSGKKSKNKKNENVNTMNNEVNNDVTNQSVTNDNLMAASVAEVENTALNNTPDVVVQNDVVSQEQKIVPEVNSGAVPQVDLPINNMDNTPISVPHPQDVVENGESVDVTKTMPLNETDVASDEHIELPKSNDTLVEQGDEVPVTLTQPLVEDAGEAAVDVDAITQEQTKASNVAFASTPDINDVPVVQQTNDANPIYTTEKTEVFEFPDFSNVADGAKSNDVTIDDVKEPIKAVENDVIDVANKYIESVMSNK